MQGRVDYSLVTAFSTNAKGGNPAAIIFLDLNLPIDVYSQIAKNLNQPISTFVAPSAGGDTDPTVGSFDVRYFAPSGSEAPLCGHGTLAAAKIIFEKPELVPPEVKTLDFHTKSMGSMRIRQADKGVFEMKLPATDTEELPQAEKDRLLPFITEAFGREVNVDCVARGGKGFETYLMVVLNEAEDLKGAKVNANTLLSSGYQINCFTKSSTGEKLFEARVFVPIALSHGEDYVSGSPYCLMGPYWYRKRGIKPGEIVKARQVSERGGDLTLVWQDDGFIGLGGELKVFGVGSLVYD